MTFAEKLKDLRKANGNPAEDFSDSDATNVIELNGARSELVIIREA